MSKNSISRTRKIQVHNRYSSKFDSGFEKKTLVQLNVRKSSSSRSRKKSSGFMHTLATFGFILHSRWKHVAPTTDTCFHRTSRRRYIGGVRAFCNRYYLLPLWYRLFDCAFVPWLCAQMMTLNDLPAVAEVRGKRRKQKRRNRNTGCESLINIPFTRNTNIVSFHKRGMLMRFVHE